MNQNIKHSICKDQTLSIQQQWNKMEMENYGKLAWKNLMNLQITTVWKIINNVKK